jgi:hypothetical protein
MNKQKHICSACVFIFIAWIFCAFSPLCALAAEDDLFITVSSQSESLDDLFLTVSSEGTVEEEKPTSESVEPAKTETEPVEKVAAPLKRLRDPFWPVGYVPDSWKTGSQGSAVDLAKQATINEQWAAAAKEVKVNFTKKEGAQWVASINRKIRRPGDVFGVQYNGKIFSFRLREVYPNGKLRLEKESIK